MSWPSYPNYRPTEIEWLDKIPEHWGEVRGKYLFSRVQRPPAGSDEIVTAFRDGNVMLRRERREEGFTIALKETGYQGVRKGDLVIHAMDAFAGAIGVSVADGKCSPVYTCCKPRKGVSARLYAYLLRAMAMMGFIESLAKGVRERSTDFRWTDFGNLRLPVPPTDEQSQITRYLNHETVRIDALIEEQQRLIDLLQEKRQAIIFHAVTKGLEPDVPMKHSGVGWLGSVPEHWQHSRLGWLCEVGNGMTPSRDDPSYWSEGDFPWLNSGNVNKERITHSDQFVTEHALNECSLPILEPRTVVMAITGEGKTRGTASIADVRSTISQHLAYIAPRNELHLEVEFLLYWLKSLYRRIRFESQGWGSTKAAITCRDIRRYPIPLPPRSEQMQICRWLKEKDRNLNALENEAVKAIRLMKEHRSTLISAAVTGKIDTRGWKPQDTPVEHDLPMAAEAEAHYG